MNNLFNKVTDKTAKKKGRAKAIHIYGDNNGVSDGDLMNLLTNSKKSCKKDSSKKDVLMLREKSINIKQKSKNKPQVPNDHIKDTANTTINTLSTRDPLDLLGAHSLFRTLINEDMGMVKSGARLLANKENNLEFLSENSIIRANLNAEHLDNCLQSITEPETKEFCEVVEEESLRTGRSDNVKKNAPIADVLENNCKNFDMNDEAIDDSEEEHEILSMLSELRNPRRSSTISLVEAISADKRAECVDSNHTNEHSQLSQVINYGNFQEEDLNFACGLSDIYINDGNLPNKVPISIEHSDAIDSMNNNSRELDSTIKSQLSTPGTSQIISYIGEKEAALLTSQYSTNHQALSYYLKELNPETLVSDQHENSILSETAQIDKRDTKESKANSASVDNLNLCRKGKQTERKLVSITRKRKSTLAEICDKTNRVKAPLRVGLSKRVKIDPLHNYLDS